MIILNSNRTEESRSWKLPSKFINREFCDFLNNTFPLEVNGVEKNVIEINGFGSVDEYAHHFQLQENYDITLSEILKLLDERGCIELNQPKNRLNYHHQNIETLRVEIEGRLRSNL